MSDKRHLEKIAEACDEVAEFADWLRGDALGQDPPQIVKADRLSEQAEDQRNWASIYRQAANAS